MVINPITHWDRKRKCKFDLSSKVDSIIECSLVYLDVGAGSMCPISKTWNGYFYTSKCKYPPLNVSLFCIQIKTSCLFYCCWQVPDGAFVALHPKQTYIYRMNFMSEKNKYNGKLQLYPLCLVFPVFTGVFHTMKNKNRNKYMLKHVMKLIELKYFYWCLEFVPWLVCFVHYII